MPCPFEAAWTTDFDFSQWFARITFSCYFIYPFDAMFENLILPANVPPVISSTLFQVIRLSALPISALRRAFHLSCCLTSF